MKKLLLFSLIFFGLVSGLQAQWDPTKPPTGPAPAVSADIRNNWNALAQNVGTVNLMGDPTFLFWAAGDAAAPTHYVLAGASAAIARAGTGLGDTNRKVGDFCAKVTSGAGAIATLTQALLPTAAFTQASFLQGQAVSAGAWLRTSSASAVRICIDDGIGQSCSSFAPGTSVWTWVTVTRTLSASATKLTLYEEVAAGTITGYYSGPTFILGPVPPSYFQPAPMETHEERCYIAGNLSTGTNKCIWDQFRPGIVLDTQLTVLTAPTTQAIIVDVKSYDGAANTTMYTTKPQIAAAANRGSASPDTTYARRCLSFVSGTSLSAGSTLTLDISQVGSGTVGADLYVVIRIRRSSRPLEAFLAKGDIN